MPSTIEFQPDDLCVLRLRGIVKRDEFVAQQALMAGKIDAGARPRVLALLEDFEGWERGADWSDLDFLFSHSNEIARIAIVGEPRWEAETLAFAGAGFRRAPVQFFPAGQEAQARAWLAE